MVGIPWFRGGLALGLLVLASQSSPTAAPTDLTGLYARPGSKTGTRIEIAANGDLRIQNNDGAYFLSHAGHDYFVRAGPGGPIVERVEDIGAARAGEEDTLPPDSDSPLVARGEITINGRTGTAYYGPPRAGTEPDSYLVVSSDPALARLGGAFQRRDAMQLAMAPTGWRNRHAISAFDRMVASGGPLRIGDEELQSVSTAPIPPSRFELPVPAEDAETVRAQWGHDSGGDDATRADTLFKRAIFVHGALWLLSDTGKLLTIREGDKAPTTQPAPEAVLDLCLDAGDPVAVTGEHSWTLRRWRGDAWTTIATVDGGGAPLVALNCDGGRLSLLTDKRLIEDAGANAHAVRLSDPLQQGLIATTFATDRALFVGVDAGEWGGGLRRIDRTTGKVTAIESDEETPCGSPLDSRCDPVNGIAAEPGKPDCLIVAVGLVHMMPHGRLSEVCGDRVRRLLYKPYTLEVSPHVDLAGPEPYETVAFYGLVPAGGGLWAVGLDGIYRIEPGGTISFRKMPRFDNVGGVWLSFAVPGLVLVNTTINGHMAMSGAVPMLVPR